MPGRRVAVISLVAAGAGLLAAFSMSWWLPGSSGQSQRTIGDQRVSDLISQGNIDDLDAADRRELLERLLASGRRQESQQLLEASIGAPRSRRERLLLIDLQLRNGDVQAASRGLNQLQRLHPADPDVLSLQALLNMQTGSPEVALKAMEERSKSAGAPQRIELGLLLADAQLRSGKQASAASTYQKLAKTDRQDTRPLIAHALLAQESGDQNLLMALLAEARRRDEAAGRSTDRVDELAAGWGVSAARLKVLGPRQGTPQKP